MSQALLLSDPVPTVSVHDGRPAVTSREVSRYFNKRHDAVLRDIAAITSNCPESFSAHNFVGASYLDEQAKSRPMYIIHRDGFMLLVMGYTGKKALAIKLAYIEAFNAMEAELARKNRPALTAARKSRVKALPEPSPVPARIDERPFLDFVEEVQQAHAQVQEIQGRLLSKGYRLTVTLCRQLRDMANVSSRASGRAGLDRALLDQLSYGVEQALTFPSDTLPNYRNPAVSLLDILRQFNGR